MIWTFRHLTILFSSLVALDSGHLSVAQPAATPDSALLAVIDRLPGTRISLEQVLQHASENATSVRSAEAILAAAEGALRRESGNYDPQLFFNVNHLDNDLPQSSYLAGAQDLATQQTTSQGGVRLNLPIGTRLEARMTTSRLETNSALASLNPEYSTAGILSLRQPLLGGFAASGRKL